MKRAALLLLAGFAVAGCAHGVTAPTPTPAVVVPESYSGTFTQSFNTTRFGGVASIEFSGRVTFVRKPQAVDSLPPGAVRYVISSGEITLILSGAVSKCSSVATGKKPLEAKDGTLIVLRDGSTQGSIQTVVKSDNALICGYVVTDTFGDHSMLLDLSWEDPSLNGDLIANVAAVYGPDEWMKGGWRFSPGSR